MMSLNVGLTVEEKFSCIVGFSGKIINQKDLKNRIKNNTETLLIHGDADQIVSSTHLLEAKDFLIRNNVKVDTLLDLELLGSYTLPSRQDRRGH